MTALSFDILGRDRGGSAAVNKVGNAAERTGKKFGFLAARTHGLTAGMTAGFGKVVAAMGAVATVTVFKGFIDEARESRKVAALTESIIRSTGGAAKISAKQVGDLATAISNKTGVDDEAIQSGSNLLLTFKNVRNEVGKGANIFDRATQAAVDLSAAGFGDIAGASKMLGKALNDPLKGITALGRAGVTFTADQKKQIATLVETGKTLEAQKIILKEVESQVGGAAAAAADPMQKLGVILGNVKESIGTAFLPIVDKAAGVLGRVVPVAVGKALTGFGALAAAFREGDVTSGGFVGAMERIGVAARSAFGFFKVEVLPRLKEFGSFIATTAAPAVATFGKDLASTLGPAVKDVFGFVKTEVIPRLKEFGGFLGESVLPKVGQLATSLSKNKDFLVPFAATILTVVAALKIWAVVQGILNVVLAANPLGLIVIAIAAFVGGLVWAYKNSETFRKIVNGVFSAVRDTAVTVFKAVVGAVKFAIDWVKGNWPILLGILTGPFGLAVVLIARNWDAIKSAAQSALRFVVMKVLDFAQGIITGASKAFGWVPGIGPKLKTAATEFAKFRDSVNAKLGGITDQSINFTIKYSNTGVNLSTPSGVGRRAMGGPGGKVFGGGTTTSDSVGPYMLSRKEWVINAASSTKYGDKVMESINAGTATVIPGFASGGRPGLTPRLVADSSGLARSVKHVVSAAAASAAKALAKAGGGLAGTMAFGRSQAGKPYVWGGVGPSGYDCSGFISALINYARGRNPYRRLGSTGTMPWGEFGSGSGRFMVGWFKGNPGHTAATVNGVNFESRGGRGVVVGSGARGAYDRLFTSRARVKGFAEGGRPGLGDLPFDILDPRGKAFVGKYQRGTPWVPNDQLAFLHRGEAVIPPEVNRRLRMPMATGGTTVTLRVESGGSRMDDLIVEMIRRYVRVNGGDVQVVLGR